MFPVDVEVQRKIAGILSAYDDLIENNRRRIAILELMAEELYREWFVRMRFPGYQNTKFVKGVPEGWEECGLASLGDYLNGFAFKPSHWGLEGIPIIKIREMTSGITRETPRNSGDGIQPRYEVNDGDIIFSWSATLLVQIWNQGRGLLNQHLFKVTPKPGVPKNYLFLALKAALPIFDSLTTGATMKHIKRKELEVAKVVKPTNDLLQNFDRHAEPMLSAVMKHSRSLLSLIEQRDSLLGRLISGKSSVEHMPVLLPANMSDVQNKTKEPAHA